MPDKRQDEITRFDHKLPLASALTPPSSWYTDSGIYRLEMQRAFGNNWLIAARADQVDQPTRYVCGEIAGERYVVVRGEDGELRAFFNVCRHHAAAVVEGEGNIKRFACPYHGWTYGLDGRLANAPELGEVQDFDPDHFGLKSIAVDTWGPFVFICMGATPRDLAEDLQPLKEALDATKFESLTFIKRQTYTIECNWKVYIDNYLDGGYHVAYLHKGLAEQLDLASYGTRVFERFSIQSGSAAEPTAEPKKAGPARAGGDFAERIGKHVLYAWLYPNFMINRYGSIMDTNCVRPLGVDRTEVVFDYYFHEAEGAQAQDFIRRSLAASDLVQQEDTGICEAVQMGLLSRSYDQGRYSAQREMGEYHFHRLLAEDLNEGAA
ncbi:MAG: aromatic ring-hydroxylating dioxygenase subunit alpha [Candidatus Krumholzibacteria bacterium]